MYLLNSGLFIFCAALNLVNGIKTGNGFCYVLTALWLLASAVSFVRYRQLKKNPPASSETAGEAAAPEGAAGEETV